MKLKRILLIAIFCCAILLQACNNDSTSSDTATDRTTVAPTDSTQVPSGSQALQPTENIQDNYGAFSILPSTGWTKVGNIYTINTSIATGYTISGALIGGQIVFADTIEDSCDLYLDNVYLKNDTSPVIIWRKDSKKVATKSKVDTINYLISGTANDGLDISTIISENNVDIGGYGTTNIISYSKHAIDASNVSLKGNGTSSVINIKGAADGVHCKQAIVESGNVNIIGCGDDGIDAALNKNSAKGTIAVSNGVLKVEDCNGNGLKAETTININSQTRIKNCTVAYAALTSLIVNANNIFYVDDVAQAKTT